MALNGGPMFKLNEAFSLFVGCETQEEIDELWAKLVEGGSPSRCGWLKDKVRGVLEIVPKVLGGSSAIRTRTSAARCRRCCRWASWIWPPCSRRATAHRPGPRALLSGRALRMSGVTGARDRDSPTGSCVTVLRR